MNSRLKSALCMLLLLSAIGCVQAGEKKNASWGEIADDMVIFLGEAGKKYVDGDVDGAKSSVNDAYFGLYEKMGFERTVLNHISGKRVSLVEFKFSLVKKEMTKGARKHEILAELAEISRLLVEDGDRLDGKLDEAPEVNEEFIVPTAEEILAFEEAVSPEGLTPEEFEEKKIEYILKMREQKENSRK